MLRLDKMQISGFKSFRDKTEVHFPGGITAVVGPNGCGKSNIGDAINWVLGEQSAKMLRGKQMADVIFNGSEARKPLGMAEVSIHLSGGEALPGADEGNVVVTRRLFRSGESDYLLNGNRSRLKDIQEILNRARVGARTYATIEQGKIEQILNAKPKDRRLIIEDAAGIAGYKHKRRLTELKLEATQANLLRVNDIIVEVERQVRTLKRQAAKARRYRNLRDQLREKEQIRFAVRARGLEALLHELREGERRARDSEVEAAAGLGRLEAALEQQRRELEQANQEYREASERLHRLELEVDREESQIRSCRERISEAEQSSQTRETEAQQLKQRHSETWEGCRAQAAVVERGRKELEETERKLAEQQQLLAENERRAGSLAQEIEALRRKQFESMNRAVELRNQLRSHSEAQERIRIQRMRLEGERSNSGEDWERLTREAEALREELERETERLSKLEVACSEGEQQLVQVRERHTEAVETLAASREREKSAVARLATLQDVATRFAGVSDGARTLLGSGAEVGLRALGVVADFIDAGADVESAAEGYLKSFLPTVILEDDSDVEQATRLLRSSGAGRTSLISRAQPAGALAVGTGSNGNNGLPPELAGDSRVRGRLSDRLTVRASANGVLQGRVGDALLVDSLASALELHRQYPANDYLTPEGDVVYASGVVSAGGSQSGDQGLLAHRRRTLDAEAECAAAATSVEQGAARAERSKGEIERVEQALQRARQELDETRRAHVALDLRVRLATDEGERTGRRTEVLALELQTIAEETLEHERSLEGLAGQVRAAEQGHGGLESQLAQQLQALESVQMQLKELGATVTELRAEQAAKQERLDSAEKERRQLEISAGELGSRIEAVEGESRTAIARATEMRELLERTEGELVQHLQQREELGEQSRTMEQSITERQTELAEREVALRKLRAELEQNRRVTHEAEVARTRAEADRSHLDDLCRQELGISAADAAGAADSSVDEVDVDLLEQEVAALRTKIESIGPVNMTALEEFTELEERHEFLTTQRDDLDSSMASLKQSIQRINRTSRERFLVAFEAIRASYKEIFKLLFNGGRADLELEEGDDVLECGIEIMAQPPGKRLGSVQLMSGGEKSMSAIALLFAVFRYQPSPFCLLDEVDAALDDANVGRFARMVGEYARQTQFIIITHNKLSMEVADLLYGVTMEEPGVSKVVSMEMH